MKITGMPNIIRNLIFSLQIIAVIVVIVLFLTPGYKDFMFITGIIDVAAVLYAFQTMMGLVPRNLDNLYDRKIIVLKNIENKSKTGTHQISGDLLRARAPVSFCPHLYWIQRYDPSLPIAG